MGGPSHSIDGLLLCIAFRFQITGISAFRSALLLALLEYKNNSCSDFESEAVGVATTAATAAPARPELVRLFEML